MRRATALTVWVVLVAACGGSGGQRGTTPSSSFDPIPSTTTLPAELAFDEEGEGRRELIELRTANDGVLPTQAALDLFSAIFGDVPGADPDRFPVEEHDGTMAILEVLGRWDELTPEQQAAIDFTLDGSGPGALREVSIGHPASGPLALGSVHARVTRAEAEIADRLGRPLGIPVNVEVRPPEEVTVRDTPVNGYAYPTRGGVRAFSGRADGCTFRLKDTAAYRTIVHEMFHCFQYGAVDDVTEVTTGQRWIVEGSATWVAARIAGVDDFAVIRTTQWMRNLSSVFGLSYPALVFYWIVEDMGVDPFGVLLEMLGKRGETAVAATGLEPGAVLPHIATERAAALAIPPTYAVSDVWQLAPSDVPPRFRRTPVTVSEDAPFEDTRAHGQWAPGGIAGVTFEEEGIAHVRVEADAGAVQFDGHELHGFEGSFDREFCLRPGGCSCGSEEAEESLPPGSQRMLVTGIERDGGDIHVLIELDEFDEEFPEGAWDGTFSVTTTTFDIAGNEFIGETFATAFAISVDGGVVTGGFYTILMDQQVKLQDGDSAQGVGSVDGVITGCAFLPIMIPTLFAFEGTARIDGETRPFNFSQPMGGGGPVPPAPWHFDVRERDHVSGTLDNSAHLAFMRSVGVEVVDVEIRFEATRID